MTKLLLLLLATTFVAGCASAPTRTGPPPVGDRAGAPAIPVERDLASRATDPCTTLLTEDQVRRLGYDSPGTSRTTIAGSSACLWREGALGRRADVSVALGGDLFVDTYRRRVLPVFKPLEIAGSPAVDIMSSPSALTCTTTVGVADEQSLDVNITVRSTRGGRPASDPCEEGHRVAEAIVSSLPPKRR